MKLSIIVPLYNEDDRIEACIQQLLEVDITPLEKQIIVVDDGSTDKSYELAEPFVQDGLILSKHSHNLGKGAAFKTGLNLATGDIIVPFDADLEYSVDDLKKVALPIANGEAEVVYGSRRLEKSNKQYASWSFYLGGVGLTFCANILYPGLKITDEPTCLKCFQKHILDTMKIKEDRFGWEPEVTAKLAKRGVIIKEVPIKYYPRDKSHGKKIRWGDGVEALWILFKERFKK